MKKIFFFCATLLILALAGCGGSDNPPRPFITQILSDAALDGDIARSATGVTTIITQGTSATVQSFFAGFDPANGDELRAFLQFPLNGAGGVPGNAVIAAATLDFVITSIDPNPLSGTIPLRIDLVDLRPATLVANDFSRTLQPHLATLTVSPPISQADFGKHVLINVTPLMVEAQRLGLLKFQVRILRDTGTAAGLIEINDTTGINRPTLAPLLEVSYF